MDSCPEKLKGERLAAALFFIYSFVLCDKND